MADFSKTENTNYPRAIVLHSHPPVTSNMPLAITASALVAGTVLSLDASNDFVPYDGTASASAVLLEDVPVSTVATTAKVLVHGVVDASLITPNTPATLLSLSQNNIYS